MYSVKCSIVKRHILMYLEIEDHSGFNISNVSKIMCLCLNVCVHRETGRKRDSGSK